MLDKDQKKSLRTLAHGRNVVIRIGQNGLTENVLAEIEQALDHHELLKIGIRVGDRQERDAIIAEAMKKTGADLVQKIGNTVVLFRRNRRNPVIPLPGSG
jgi:RNA-binding protein